MKGLLRFLATTGLLVVPAAGPASADAVADFYRGKTVTIVVAAGPGGGHTVYSQLLAPYFEKYMPGHPTFVTQNMGGAGGTRAANHLYNSAPQDGTHIGILLSDTPMAARLEATGIKYDPARFHYLGGADVPRSAFVVMKRAGAATLADAKAREVTVGSSGKGSQTYIVPIVVNAMLGTKFKVITGYRGMGDIYLAIDRGEVDGYQGVVSVLKSLRTQWFEQDLIRVPLAVSLDRVPEFPDAPLLVDLVMEPVDRQIAALLSAGGVLGRCWLAPPGVPPERVAALRAAFAQALADPAAAAEAKTRNLDWEPVRWQDLQAQAQNIASADVAVFERMRAIIGTER
jgi:tripartite-type tricarboxylate transporter receptor subunit TctC